MHKFGPTVNSSHVITLPSHINVRGRKVGDNFRHKVNYRYCCYLPSLAFIYVPESSVQGLSSQGRREG
jgi:hypothetical protein